MDPGAPESAGPEPPDGAPPADAPGAGGVGGRPGAESDRVGGPPAGVDVVAPALAEQEVVAALTVEGVGAGPGVRDVVRAQVAVDRVRRVVVSAPRRGMTVSQVVARPAGDQ